MSSKETQAGARSEGNVKNTPELAIASSAINSKNGESTVVIDIPDKDSKPAAPASTSPPSGSPRRTHDHQVHHQAGDTSGGRDVTLDEVQLVKINIHEEDPESEYASPTSSYPEIEPAPQTTEKMAACARDWGMASTTSMLKPVKKAASARDWGSPARIRKPVKVGDSKDREVNSSKNSSVRVAGKIESLEDALVPEDFEPKIQWVPFIMRREGSVISSRCYEPRMVSIGPYYHQASPKLKEGEKLKLKLAALFVRKHGLQKDVLYSKIKGKIKELRSCYKQKRNRKSKKRFNPDDDELTWMFFVDGCAILHYIDCAAHRRRHEIEEIFNLKVKIDILTFMEHDLFLLENQLPYRVLDLLMSFLKDRSEMRESIEKFIFQNIKAPSKKQDQEEPPIHLLDLLRTIFLQHENSTCQQRHENSTCQQTHEKSTCQQTPFFRSVEELKAAGIRIRPSNTGHLKDITYNHGTLKLPPITVDDFTASKFLNLIAYEMCPDFQNDFGVTSYILFLDALIDGAQDVKELRDKHILHNALGSDKEVAKLFNEIGTNLVSNPKAYSDVKSAIQKRCGNRWMTWIAQFNHQHFQSPWSVTAFLAAIIALVLTFLQTIYTIWG